MLRRMYKPGDFVVYRKRKHTTHPGVRARSIEASPRGDYYTYFVDKFWIVGEVLANGRLSLRTRRGKTHTVSQKDANLRRPNLWDRIRYRSRFAELQRHLPGI